MKPIFSLLHASYGRPEKAREAMKLVMSRAKQPDKVEYLFALNHDDAKLQEYHDSLPTGGVLGNFIGSAAAWNAAANASTGEVLIQMQDDLELPQDWDAQLLDRLISIKNGNHPTPILWLGYPVFIAVSDGYRKDDLCCTAIMNRARYIQQGEFLHPGYMSVFSDDEVTVRALADAADGKCIFVNARDLVFLHRHCYHDKSVAEDDTYRRENSPEAYGVGGKLFFERNAHLVKRGLKTW